MFKKVLISLALLVVLTTQAYAVVGTTDVTTYKTGGSGTSASPYTGWCSTLNTNIASGNVNRRFYMPAGYWTMDCNLLIADSYISIEGDGKGLTVLQFNQTGAGITLNKQTSGTTVTILENQLKGFSLSCSQSGTVGIKPVNARYFTMHDVLVNCSTASGDEALQTNGRDNSVVSNSLLIGRPAIHIKSNQAFNEYTSLDHWVFSNTLLQGVETDTTNPLVLIDDDIVVSNVTFDSIQPWIFGCSGIKWYNTTASQAHFYDSINFRLDNIRHEQGTCSGGWTLDIQFTGDYKLQQLLVNEVTAATIGAAFKLKGIEHATFNGSSSTRANNTMFDFDSSVRSTHINNMGRFQAGTADNITGQTIVYREQVYDDNYAIAAVDSTVHYVSTADYNCPRYQHSTTSYSNNWSGGVGNDKDHYVVCTLEPGAIDDKFAMRVSIDYYYQPGSSPGTVQHYLKLGGTKVYTQNVPMTPTASQARSVTVEYMIYGTAAPGGSVTVDVSPVGSMNEQGFHNSTASTTLATNGSLAVLPGVTWSVASGGAFTPRNIRIERW